MPCPGPGRARWRLRCEGAGSCPCRPRTYARNKCETPNFFVERLNVKRTDASTLEPMSARSWKLHPSRSLGSRKKPGLCRQQTLRLTPPGPSCQGPHQPRNAASGSGKLKHLKDKETIIFCRHQMLLARQKQREPKRFVDRNNKRKCQAKVSIH